jgi:hypothetical protein
MQIAASILISVVVWVIATVVLVFLGAILTGGFLTPSFRESAIFGLIVGLLHGALTGTIIYWQQSESAIGSTLVSVAASESLIIFGGVAWFLYRYFNPIVGGAPAPPAPASRYFLYIYALLIWFGILSAVLLLPSIVAGLANKLIST